ncbi:MAG: PD-(D/E)XK nuclease-like domain-containing protein [Clostridia bacterium]|nr:PD-(D/E)XK nuclease-like domain-containing protein [Clostridia bacterium]
MSNLILTRDNYFSPCAEKDYVSCSQFLDFFGGGLLKGCEARAMAKIRGEWIEEQSTALLVGSYVHSWNEGPQERSRFIAEHPEMFTKQGGLKCEYKQADEMIAALENDEMCMFMLNGQKEIIFTAELFGLKWKVRFDNYLPEKKRSSDLKTTRSISDKDWICEGGINKKVSFVEAYCYPLRAAVYCEVERLAMGRPEGDWIDFYLVAVSKEDPPDKAVISLKDPERYIKELSVIEECTPRLKLLKEGRLEPIRCEQCAYCRSTKQVSKVIHYSDI